MNLRFNFGITYITVMWYKGKLPYNKCGDAPYELMKKIGKELRANNLILPHDLSEMLTKKKKL